MTVFCAALCGHEIVVVPDFIHMRTFQITSAGALPNPLAFSQLFAGFDIDFTLNDTVDILLVMTVADEIGMAVLKIKGRINAVLVHLNGLGPFPVNVIGIYIEIFEGGIVVCNHIKPSVMVSDGWGEYAAGTANLMQLHLG